LGEQLTTSLQYKTLTYRVNVYKSFDLKGWVPRKEQQTESAKYKVDMGTEQCETKGASGPADNFIWKWK